MVEAGNFWRVVRNAVACALAVLAVSCGGGGGSDADATASRNSAVGRALDASPGGPILIVTSNASPFSEYYAEILRNEGFNQFSLTDASSLTASDLTGFDVVLLGKTSLAPDQVNALAHWVSGGGNLIAMAPDAQLAPLLGITPNGAAMVEGYLKIDNGQAPGAGLVGETIQYHGSAERYSLHGASSIATLYSDANRATPHPAVTTRIVGNGSASAFAYDLATSVVYTRQGNPAWADQERDGVAPVTSSDRFFGGTAPDWVDRGKVAIAQADEQQRLLANMILNVERARKPLPRFWYFPDGKKAIVVTTGGEQGDSAANQARLDTSWSFASPVWSAAPGLFAGSAMPMRLSTGDGKVVNVYQAPAQVDNVGQSVDALLDRATGAEGYYGAFVVRTASGRLSADAVTTTPARDVPVLTARQLLTWLDARNASSFAMTTWNGSSLGFELRAAADAVGLQSMLPWRFGARTLKSLKRDGNAHEFTVKTIKGIDYAVFAAASGAYVAQYDDAGVATRSNPGTGAVSANGERARALAVYSGWDNGALPANPSINEALPVELGVKFRTNVTGVVTGVRFYKGAGNTGSHVGNLWTAGGQLLATATFNGETATGWQQVTFATPVAISANTVYVASYFAPNGGYAYDSAYFAATGVVNGAVELLRNGVSGGNGVYAYNASSSFPGNSFNATNYWVDVVFDDAAGPADTTPPVVNSTLPTSGATDVPAASQVRTVFSEAMDESTINSTTFELRNASNVIVPATISYDPASRTAILTPSSALPGASVFTATVRGGSTDPRVKDLAGNALANALTWSFTTGSSTSGCPCSAWASTAVPGTASYPDSGAIELGVKFRTDVAGYISGVRFYKGAGNSGVHIGNLWSSTGQLLASATFTGETATGWQQVNFGSPVPINANTVYVASYFAPNGGYAADGGYFATTGVDNGLVHLPTSGTSGGNGMYRYAAASSFPTQTFGATNYWVDIVFDTTAPNDNVPPTVQSTAPGNGATAVATSSVVGATFSEALDPATVVGSTFELRNAANVLVSASVSYDAATRTATLTPGSTLAVGTTYTATLRGGGADPRIKDLAGNALGANVSWSFTTATSDPCSSSPNPIVAENCLPGNPASEWDISGAGDFSLQGYATQMSVNKGQTISFKVDTSAPAYRFDIYRLGYYGGAGARKVATVQPSVAPQPQPPCLTDPSTGLVDCGNWFVTGSWAVPSNAVSGIYIARLVRPDTNGASHIVFIVRDDAANADVLYKTSDTTWQAYNDYGGNSLYVGSPAGRAYKVSYNRPFVTRGAGFGYGRAWLFGSEYPMVRWLESNGYNMSYLSGIDLEQTPSLLTGHRVLLSVGHDEYWSQGQRAAVEGARDAGVHLAFFTANEMFWKTRWENSIDGTSTAYRTLVSYKETHANAKIDPSSVWTGTWRDPRFSPPADGNRPENALTGTIFTANCCGPTAGIAVPAEFGNLRFWRNTSIANLPAGQVAQLPLGTLGYEWDEDLDNGWRPAGLFRMSETARSDWPMLLDYGSTFGPGSGVHHLVMHKRPNGALVFAAGTIRWSWGLDGTHDFDYVTPDASTTPDARMQQATINILADMNAQPGSPRPGMVSSGPSTDFTSPASTIASPAAGAGIAVNSTVVISGAATDSGGVVAGVEVSVDGGATWHPATGRGTWSYSWRPTTSGAATVRSRAVDDSGNIQATPASVNVTVGAGGDATPPTITARSPTSGATGVALVANVTVTFNEAMDPNTIGASTFELRDSGNALVAASMTYDAATRVATLNPTPTLTSQMFYTVRVRGGGTDPRVKDAAGNALAADATWTFTTQAAGDTTPPTISAQSPVSGATGVAATANVTVTFNEAMDASTISGSTFELRDSASALVAATVTYDAATRVATLNPTSTLGAQVAYSVRVRGGGTDPRVKDPAGNALAADSTWTFTTAAAGDTTPPTISAQSPVSGATGVSATANVTVTFNEAMGASTISGSTFELRDSASALVAATVTYDAAARVATLNPTPTLAAQATYFVRVRGGGTDPRVKDAAGNALAADATWTFTTGGDGTSPTIAARSPTAGATAVSRTTNITVTFSEAMTSSTITTSTFELRDAANVLISSSVSYNSSTRVATLNPAPTLFASTVYTVMVRGGASGAKDLAGNVLAADAIWSFTTAADTAAPTVSSISPSSGAVFVSRSANVTATFNEDMDASTISGTTFELRGPNNTLIQAVVTYDPGTRRATLNPNSSLAAFTRYTATVRGGSSDPRVKDAAGNALSSNRVWSFTTL